MFPKNLSTFQKTICMYVYDLLLISRNKIVKIFGWGHNKLLTTMWILCQIFTINPFNKSNNIEINRTFKINFGINYKIDA